MFKSRKTTLIFLSIILSILLASTIILFANPFNVKASSGDVNITYTSKDIDGFQLSASYKNDDPTPSTIHNTQYILLEKDTLSSYNKVNFSIESFGNKYITDLRLNAYLNGEDINVDITKQIESSINQLTCSTNFTISRDSILKYKTNNEIVTSLQGHYEFEFRVTLYDSTTKKETTMQDNYWYKFEFTIIDANQYNNVNQLISLENVTNYGENSFVNNYIKDTTSYSEAYANLQFDAEKYKLVITRTYEGLTYVTETSFQYYTSVGFNTISNTPTNYGKLSFISSDKTISFNLIKTSNDGQFFFIFNESNFVFNDSKTTNYNQPLFYELGEYKIQPYYQIYQNGELLYDDDEDNLLVHIPQLTLKVCGFNLNYAYNVTGKKYFANFSQNGNTLADFTSKQTSIFNITDIVIPSTNQAPVWFNCFAESISSISYNYGTSLENLMFNLGLSAGNSTQFNFIDNSSNLHSIDKNFYFTEAGYYYVKCTYTQKELNGNQNQYFIFQITNSTPYVSINEKVEGFSDSTIIASGSFTNKNVFIGLQETGLFDSEVTAQYSINTSFDNTFTNYTPFTPKFGQSSNYTIFKAQGKYSIKVLFGKQSVSYYTFTIDLTDIKNFVRVSTVKSINAQNSTSTLAINKNVTDKTVLNESFTVAIQQKPSGASIEAKLTTFDIESYVPTQNDIFISNSDKEYIDARYRATYASSPMPYNNIVNNFTSFVSSNFVFSEHKIYIFQISDSAGFSYVHVVYLDKSEANVLQYDSSNNLTILTDFNIVSSKTTLKWAKYKALEFIGASGLSNNASTRNSEAIALLQNNPYFDYDGSTFLMLLALTNIDITSTELDGSEIAGVSGHLYNNYKNNSQFTIYGLESDASIDGITNKSLYGEKKYSIKIYDESGNVANYSIEVNMDKSLGKMFAHDGSSYRGQNQNSNYAKLDINDISSLNYLTFEWKDDKDGLFEIESIKCDFYPLVYDTSQKFPYTETATKSFYIYNCEDNTIHTNIDISSGLSFSDPINIVAVTYTETSSTGEITSQTKNVTEAGKYVITRTYKNNASESEGDKKEKEYTYFVDRNPILDYPQSGLITNSSFSLGGKIELQFSKNSTFNEFYRESIDYLRTSDGTLYYSIESNYLPIKIKIPINKYSYFDTNAGLTAQSAPIKFNLVVTIVKYDASGNELSRNSYNTDPLHPDYEYNGGTPTGYIAIPDITSSGYYKIYIHDNAVTPNDQISPTANNKNYFGLYVNLSSPEATFITGNTKANIGGEDPISISIDKNSMRYIVSFDDDEVNQITFNYRFVGPNEDPTNIAWISDESLNFLYNGGTLGIIDNDSGLLIQYKLHVVYNNKTGKQDKYIETALYSDYSLYKEVSSNSATKDNYVLITFNDADEAFKATVDVQDLKIDRYEKVNNSYTNKKELKKDVDYVVQERFNPNTNQIYYSVLLYSIDNEGENTSKEYKYTVTYHYNGNEQDFIITNSAGVTESKYSNTQEIYIDKTAPYYNINRLLSDKSEDNSTAGRYNATYLTKYNEAKYRSSSYSDSNNIYYYANISDFDFAVTGDFKFMQSLDANGFIDTQESVQIYYRKLPGKKYNPESETNINQYYQSIVPGDEEYISSTSAKLRFNPLDTNTWQTLNFNQKLSDQIYDYYGGYYEIIEVDAVGNYTIYTILYIPQEIPVLTFIKNDNSSDDGEKKIYYSVESYNYITIASISYLETWYTIDVSCDSVTPTTKYSYNVTPGTDINEIINSLNNIFNNIGNYTLNISNRFGNDLVVKISISYPTAEFEVKLDGNKPGDDGFYHAHITNNNADGLILENVKIKKFDSEHKHWEYLKNDEGEYVDSLGTKIIINGTEESRKFCLDEGIYIFEITDNFHKIDPLEKTVNVGNFTSFSFSYENKTIINGKTYTTSNVVLNADQGRYTISATQNGSVINVTSDIFTFYAPTESPDANVVSGGDYEYIINILDNTTNILSTETFIIYNTFPAISAKNSTNENINKIMATSANNVSTFTSDSVLLQWSTIGMKFGYSFELRKYESLSYAGTNLYTVHSVNSNGATVTAKGAYQLLITNTSLKNTRSIWFVIRESELSMYSVSEKQSNGSIKILSPSSTLLTLDNDKKQQIIAYLDSVGKPYAFPNTLQIKNYFSIYDFQIDIDGDKGLNSNWGTNQIIYNDSTMNTKIVIVYGISPYNYLDIFAVTKIEPNSHFVDILLYKYYNNKTNAIESVAIDTASFDMVNIYENPVTLYWYSYYEIQQNKTYMTYTYNGKEYVYSNRTKDLTNEDISNDDSNYNKTILANYIELVDDGEYKFSFKDLAGNSALFGNYSSSEITIIIKSKVEVTINDELPINGAIYNDAVNFNIPNASDYVEFNVKVFLNGVEQTNIKFNKNLTSYTFTNAGFYKIFINGKIRRDNFSKPDLQENIVSFTIINPNESKYAYEFPGINGYEITRVIKNNYDITSSISENGASIYNLVLSDDVNGIGKYTITVHATFVNSLQEDRYFTFSVWINNKNPALQCNTERNEITKQTIVITYNAQSLYEQLGECKIVIGKDEYLINETTASKDENLTISIDQAGTHYIKLVSNSGNVISVYKVIKQDPLNALSIILIILGVILLSGGGYLFFRLRIKMKIK